MELKKISIHEDDNLLKKNFVIYFFKSLLIFLYYNYEFYEIIFNIIYFLINTESFIIE